MIKMQIFMVLFLSALVFVSVNGKEGLTNLIGTEMQSCLNCMCHARSGCWSRFNCARYSVSKDYWKKAGSPSVASYSNSDQAYTACMNNENCILNTLKRYTESFGESDCNCDGIFDCKDRLAIHLFGESCYNPKYGGTYSRRFNECAREIGVSTMSPSEGSCLLPDIDVRSS